LRGVGAVVRIAAVSGHGGRRRWGGSVAALIAVFAVAALAPTGAAAAEEQTFAKVGELFPSGDANGTFGPANEYPARIVVPPTPGTVVKVSVTVLALSSGRPEDIDMALVGPNGRAVMLMSDACGDEAHHLNGSLWTFEDEAPTFLSKLGCPSGGTSAFKPTNYFEEEHPDQLEVRPGEGPPGPYGNELAVFDGIEPTGDWDLYVLDDDAQVVGFGLDGWTLNLDVEPPPPTTIPPPATTPPPATVGPAPIITAPTPPAPVAKPKRTGRRAAALAKCKKKKTSKARLRCRVQARKLPA
jgi:hypothetical protein